MYGIKKINSVLVIDDQYEEVRNIITALNKNGIPTIFKDDCLKPGNESIDEFSTVIILDLYLGSSEDKYTKALDTVTFLSEKMKIPYFIFVWSKNEGEFEDFVEEVEKSRKELPEYNFPIAIDLLSETKDTTDKCIFDKISGKFANLQENYQNINALYNFINMQQQEAGTFWELLLEKVSDKESINSQTGLLFKKLDDSQGYEISGKGLLLTQSRFLENKLTEHPLSYEYKDGDDLSSEIIDVLNELFITHKIEDGGGKIFSKPGMIVKNNSKKLGIIEPLIEKRNENAKVKIEVEYNGDNKLRLKKNDSECESRIEKGNLIINPFCDWQQNKTASIMTIDIIEIQSENCDDFCSWIGFSTAGQGFKRVSISKDKILLLDLRKISSINSGKTFEKKDVFSYYLTKEIVNDIQHGIGQLLSRVGYTSIPK